MKRLDQSGSHLLAIALVVVVLAVVGLAGYKVMGANKTPDPAAATTKKSTAVPSSITNTAQLTQAATALDNSSAQLNSGLDDSQLNGSLNDML